MDSDDLQRWDPTAAAPTEEAVDGAPLSAENATSGMRVMRGGSGRHHGPGTLLGWKVGGSRHHDTSGGLSSDDYCRVEFDHGGGWNMPMSSVTVRTCAP